RDENRPLTAAVAESVADAMKCWAQKNGATHYTHWFIPLTGLAAGKHEAFLAGVEGGQPIYTFSGNMLIKGEGDASSLPSGGLRATFEARGYTAWDPTSPAFILGTTLYIPTAFYSYNGEALDQKTPLLRSMQHVGDEAARLLRLIGNDNVKSVKATVGAEQEYFLVDRAYYSQRLDLMVSGRTMFGAKPPKGQQLEDHYYSRIRTRVMAFMEDLDFTLWSLGVPSKTRHNETAPSQYEVACIFSTANIALDHNQLVMQVMRSVARRHDFVCLLHEKPFDGVNGSGKHNNWSLMTDTGENLFSPGDDPSHNIRFLLFLSAVVRAVDLYADLVRLSACSAGNDHRLGGNEAPPAVISLFLGEYLSGILKDICDGAKVRDIDRSLLFTGVGTLPSLELDDSDRNRTSPFAFTGNKFEFRMVGSMQSIGFANTVINTIVANSLKYISERLEAAEDTETAAKEIIGDIYKNHSRIVFNGDNYAAEWITEAERRGLANDKTLPEAMPALLLEKNIRLFEDAHVLSETELNARYEIMLGNYIDVTLIEAGTMTEMVRRGIMPACISYAGSLARDHRALEAAKYPIAPVGKLLSNLTSIIGGIESALSSLNKSVLQALSGENPLEKAELCRRLVLPEMQMLRHCCDEAEQLLPSDMWPFPTYTDMFYKQ
ncbi:MAG: glutamine synthetase III, partial [Oscillospiraceae bacterium]|nr:glutamine synthetase III [Oscillospiraceae bacterium]